MYHGKLDFASCTFNVLISRNHYLMISDIFSQRFNIHLSCMIASLAQQFNYPTYEMVEDFYRIGDSLILEYGNESYKTIKRLEECAVSFLLIKETDKAVDTMEFKNRTQREFCLSQGESEENKISELFEQYMDPLFNRMNKHQISQIFGLYRLFEHPTIDTRAGMEKLKSIAKANRAMDKNMIAIITWKWREMLFRNYYKKHRKYPNYRILSNASNFLTDTLEKQLPFSTKSPSYHLSLWDDIEPTKTFEVPEKFDLLDLIADKSLSLPKSKLKEYCKKGEIGPQHERSVVMNWLQSQYVSPQTFL